MRIMIAGTGSGCGKTTVACALLTALKTTGRNPVSFKCGPDYIDPTFHRQATGIDCFNLDTFLMGEDGVQESLAFHSAGRGISVLEGVMGFYDGIGAGTEASSCHLANVTNTPVILVVNTKGKSVSICAEIHGFQKFATNNIVAVILNRTKPERFSFYKNMIENETGLHVAGFLPEVAEAEIRSRHLGLVPATEITDIQNKVVRLGEMAMKHFDFDLLFDLAKAAPQRPASFSVPPMKKRSTPRIYVADDKAFCFHYADNHRILKHFGAEIRRFSPLHDSAIPEDADGLIFWGGYPELHAKKLAANRALGKSVRKRHEHGMPIYAECGGFMYANERLIDGDGVAHEMLGIVKGTVRMTDRLQRFGYVELQSNTDNLLCKRGDKINAHSFHYSRGTDEGSDFTATRPGQNDSHPCIIATNTLFAGYPHLHFAGNRSCAERFVVACRNYRETKQ